MIMYHGTTRANARSIKASGFRQSSDGMLGRGVYLSSDLKKASRYPIDHPKSDRAVIKVSVKPGKVKRIDRQGHPLQKTWHDHGYDTAWVPADCGMVPSGLEEDCVWDPRRIRIIEIIYPDPDEVSFPEWELNTTREDQQWRDRHQQIQQGIDLFRSEAGLLGGLVGTLLPLLLGFKRGM